MLIEALWEDRPPARALGTVRTYVSRLRQRLEPDRDGRARLLVSVTGGYALRIDPDSADVHRFNDLVLQAEQATARDDHAAAAESLREALALWGAEPLAGLPGTYAEGRRRKLIERRTEVAERRFEAELALGRHREILDELAAQAAAAPDREGLQRQWMLALYMSGRQAEALAVYGRTRKYLEQTFRTRPGPELEELHARVLSGDPEPGPQDDGEGSGHTPKGRALNQPMQLPGDVAGFSGRKGELDEVQAALIGGPRGTDPPVVVVTGIGGVGKSTLVVRAAHSIRHRFPDGQLYTDLRGIDDDPADPQNVLQRFLRAFGIPPDEIPTDLEIAAELFRTTLVGRKVLVVLDNARDVEQVRPLLAGSGSTGCATVVTSRWRLTDLEPTQAISLDVLEPSEAASMFAEIVGKQRVEKEPRAAADLLAAGGNLPLSVRILAARLVARPAWTIASLASRLDDERHRLDELEAGELAVSATFHLSFAQLDSDRQRACRLLALYSGPVIVPEIAAALLDTSREAAAAVCDSLVEAGLLDERVRHEYRFHDLVRLFAKRRGDLDAPDDSVDAVRRLLDLYLATVKHLSGVIRPNSPFAAQHPSTERDPIIADNPDAARTWVAAEADGIVDACRLGGGDVRSLELAASLTVFLVLNTDTAAMGTRLADLAKQLAARAVELGAPAPEAMARITRASALHFYQGDVQGAIHELFLARKAADLGGAVFARSEAEQQAARFLLPTGRIEEAAELLESALRGYREVGSRSDEAEVLAVLAETLAKLGRFEEAYAAADRATEIHRGLGTVSGEAEALLRSGSARLLGGDADRALSDLKTSADLYRTIGERGWLSKSLERYAATMLQAGREAEAITVAEEALTLSRETEFMLGSGRALTTLGHALALVGDLGRAEECWREAYDIFKAAGVQEAERLAELLKLETAGCASG